MTKQPAHKIAAEDQSEPGTWNAEAERCTKALVSKIGKREPVEYEDDEDWIVPVRRYEMQPGM